MKRSFILNLDSLTDLTNFCTEISSNIAADVDAAYGRQTVDAKSYLGLITISTHPIQVYINSEIALKLLNLTKSVVSIQLFMRFNYVGFDW